MRFEPRSHLPQEAEDLLLLRNRETAAPKVTDLDPEEIDPVCDRHDLGLFLVKREPANAEPVYKDRFDRLNVVPGLRGHEQVVSVATKAVLFGLYSTGPHPAP